MLNKFGLSAIREHVHIGLSDVRLKPPLRQWVRSWVRKRGSILCAPHSLLRKLDTDVQSWLVVRIRARCAVRRRACSSILSDQSKQPGHFALALLRGGPSVFLGHIGFIYLLQLAASWLRVLSLGKLLSSLHLIPLPLLHQVFEE